MSIATELSRIQADRNTIRNKLIELGLATSTDKLDALASAIEGLVNRGAVSVEILEGQTYTIPAGYHNGSGTVKAMTDTTGEAEAYKTQTKSVTPTKKQQSVTPDSGYYALSAVTVAPIPDAYQDVSSVTSAAGDVLTGKVYVAADGTVITGTMPNNGAVSKTLDVTTLTYTIPKGYHSGTGKVTITLEEKTVTPTKSAQTITPTAGKVLSKVTVDPIPSNYGDVSNTDPSAEVEGSLLHGLSVITQDENGNAVEIQGTMPNQGKVAVVLDTTTTSAPIAEGYHNGEGSVSISLETKTATPTKATQNITPSSGKVLSKVTVNPIPTAYQDVTGVTAGAAEVLVGKKIVSAAGKVVDGAMPNNGSTSATIDGLTSTSATIPAGYTSGGTISLTNDIEEALAAI